MSASRSLYELEATYDQGLEGYEEAEAIMSYNNMSAEGNLRDNDGSTYSGSPRRPNPRDKYWRGNAPVLAPHTYNG